MRRTIKPRVLLYLGILLISIPALGIAQIEQRNIEAEDAKKVDLAAALLEKGEVDNAEKILLDVVSRCPDNYVYQYEEGGAICIKFWDMGEFLRYIGNLPKDSQNKPDVSWVPSAYPRAFFLLGYIAFERKDLASAAKWFEKAQTLEPKNARILSELGFTYGAMKRHSESLRCFSAIAEQGDKVPPEFQALAFRGMGVQLIDLGQLDLARQCFFRSLKIEPDNQLAKKELLYIDHLEKGGEHSEASAKQ